MTGPYNDIINLPHPTSERHPRMSMLNRAAQFSPFAALTGYDDAVKEAARLTDARVELTEEEKSVLNAKLCLIEERLEIGTEAVFIYFQQDHKKEGGAYHTVTGVAKRIDRYTREIVLSDGQRISIEDILDIQLGLV